MISDEILFKMAVRSRQAYAEKMAEDREKAEVPLVRAEAVQLDTSAGKTPVILYRPVHSDVTEPLPVFVDIHGGGFIQGSPADDDPWCRRIVSAVHCAVVSIDYHLAPEYRFPVALYECYDVVKWVYDQANIQGFDSRRIAIGGHSAGGNLTAAITLLARERREFSLIFQVLNYPVLDFVTDPYQKTTQDTLLTAKAQSFFSACYLGDEAARNNPLASPLLTDSFAGLPPALVIAAEYDPLQTENRRYAEALAAAGVPVTYRMFAGCMHAFTHFGPAAAANEAWGLIQAQLRQTFWGKGENPDGSR